LTKLTLPTAINQDESEAFYYLPSEDFVKGRKDTLLDAESGKRLELAVKASKGSKKGIKKSAKRR
jgi:hypothetical protein